MAARVNTKFVLSLSAILIALTITLPGFWFFVIRTDASEHVQRGEKFLTQGLVEDAIQEFGKAVNKEPNVARLLGYVDAINQARTDDRVQAWDYVKQTISALSQAVAQDPANPEPFGRLMQVYLSLGQQLGDLNSWNKMYDIADAKVQSEPAQAVNVLAHKFRAIAQVGRLSRKIQVNPQERDQAQEDLAWTIEQQPEDRQLGLYFAFWHLLQAQQAEPANSAAAQAHLAEAQELTEQSLEIDPADPQRQLDHLRVLSQVDKEQALALVNQIEPQFIEHPPSTALVLGLVEQVIQLDREEAPADPQRRLATTTGLVRAEQLLRAAMGVGQEDLRLNVTLGRILTSQGRHDEAMGCLKRAYESRSPVSAWVGVQLPMFRSQAGVQYADLLLQSIHSMSQDERGKTLDGVQSLLDKITTNYGENALVNLVWGKLEMARHRWGQASGRLERANDQFNGSQPEALLLSASVLVKLGELGAAIDRLNALLKLRPDYKPARHELARIYLQLHQPSKAAEQVQALLKDDPKDAAGLILQAGVLATQGQTQEAIEVYRQVDPQQHPEAIIPLSRLYAAAGQPAAGQQLLVTEFENSPTNIGVLQELLRVTADPNQALAYIDIARQADLNPTLLDFLESRIQNSSFDWDAVEDLIGSEDDPLQRHLKRYALFGRLGRQDEAIEELEQAAQIDGDNPQVIEAQFERALVEEDWGQAQTLADRAADLNTDAAEGMFFYGRLEAGRKQYDRAMSSCRRGLVIRPNFSQGWWQLGRIQQLVGDLGSAKTSFQQTIQLAPNHSAALQGLATVEDSLGQYRQALEHLRRAYEFSPGNRTMRSQYLAYEQRHGDAKRVLQMRQGLAKADPQDTANRRNLAVMLARTGEREPARQVIDTLIEEDGANRANIAAAAAVHRVAGDNDAARAVIQDYVNSLGETATEDDWLMLAQFFVATGQFERGSAAFRQAIAVEDPQARKSTRRFADLLFSRQQFKEAAGQYDSLWETSRDDPRVGYRFVESLLRDNQIDPSQEILDEVIVQHGDNDQTSLLEAMIAQAGEDTPRALAALGRAAELNPKNAVVYYQRAQFRSGDPTNDGAVLADLNRSLSINPDLASARLLLATIYSRRGDHTQAIRELNLLKQRNPGHTTARQQLANLYLITRQAAPLGALLEESARLFPDDPLWLRLQAQQAIRVNDNKLAAEKLQAVFDLVPSPRSLADLVTIQIQNKEVQRALGLLHSGQAMVSQSPVLQGLRGRVLVLSGSTDSAKVVFSKALKQCGSFNQVAGVAQQMVGALGLDEAVSHLQVTAAQASGYLVDLAVAQIQFQGQRYEAALSLMRQLDGRIPSGAEDRLIFDRLFAMTLSQVGEYEQSMEMYQRLIELHGDDVMLLNNAAYLLVEHMDRAPEAVLLAQRATDLVPNHPLVLDTLGWAHYQAGQNALSLEVLRRSVQLRATPISCVHLAEVLTTEGDTLHATEWLQTAKRLAEQSNDQEILITINQRLEEINP